MPIDSVYDINWQELGGPLSKRQLGLKNNTLVAIFGRDAEQQVKISFVLRSEQQNGESFDYGIYPPPEQENMALNLVAKNLGGATILGVPAAEQNVFSTDVLKLLNLAWKIENGAIDLYAGRSEMKIESELVFARIGSPTFGAPCSSFLQPLHDNPSPNSDSSGGPSRVSSPTHPNKKHKM